MRIRTPPPAPDCPYGEEVPGETWARKCAKYSEAAGFGCTVHTGTCNLHFDAGGPDVPVDSTPELRACLKTDFLRTRIGAGDCPRYRGALDLDDAFARYAALSTKEEQAELLVRALEHWIAVGKKHGIGPHGGHPDDVIAEKAAKIARDHGLEDALNAWEAERLSR